MEDKQRQRQSLPPAVREIKDKVPQGLTKKEGEKTKFTRGQGKGKRKHSFPMMMLKETKRREKAKVHLEREKMDRGWSEEKKRREKKKFAHV